jgi:hypothetical protein
MVALIELLSTKYVEKTGVTIEVRWMQLNFSQRIAKAAEPVLRLFQRHPPDQSMDFVS